MHTGAHLHFKGDSAKPLEAVSGSGRGSAA